MSAMKHNSTKMDVEKVLKRFREYEESSGHRRGMLKINAPFDGALKTILKAKPEPKKRKARNDK